MNATQEIADDVHGHEHEPSDDYIDSARTSLESENEDDIHRRAQVDHKSETGGVNRVAEFQMDDDDEDSRTSWTTSTSALCKVRVLRETEGEQKYQIVVRGYDKFFNIGEVPWTAVRSFFLC